MPLRHDLSKLKLCAIYLDGVEYKGRYKLAALGAHADGRRRVSGWRQGASENAVVASSLLGDLAGCGVDFCEPRLYVVDGARALVKAVREDTGAYALIQHYQVHKGRNVCGHLSEEHRDAVDRRMATVYALRSTQGSPEQARPVASGVAGAQSFGCALVGRRLDETLTVNRLPLEGWLRRTLATTNPIKSAFSVVETVCRRVKCWQRGDHAERWVGSALWVAEANFRKVKGYRNVPKLLAALDRLKPTPPAAQAGPRRI